MPCRTTVERSVRAGPVNTEKTSKGGPTISVGCAVARLAFTFGLDLTAYGTEADIAAIICKRPKS